MTDAVCIVLVGTTHPGNIGACARAMKNMGLGDLRLVAPARFPDPEASARAAGAEDVLARASVHATLEEAVADCTLVIGTSARRRALTWPELEPRACAERIRALPETNRAAIVFGRERTGLTNEELDRCAFLTVIPANPEYNSLNLAAAVQIIAYELFVAGRHAAAPRERDLDGEGLATAEEMEGFYAHLERVLAASGFLDPANPRHLLRRLRRLFGRAQPDRNELNILRGMLAAIEQWKRSDSS
ncbi:MAG TPA: RNA methyltransferase [Gammaproteobacteria bacterium]|nr:RNA methyltransferase [Gammaproteobacteria bacterium]